LQKLKQKKFLFFERHMDFSDQNPQAIINACKKCNITSSLASLKENILNNSNEAKEQKYSTKKLKEKTSTKKSKKKKKKTTIQEKGQDLLASQGDGKGIFLVVISLFNTHMNFGQVDLAVPLVSPFSSLNLSSGNFSYQATLSASGSKSVIGQDSLAAQCSIALGSACVSLRKRNDLQIGWRSMRAELQLVRMT